MNKKSVFALLATIIFAALSIFTAHGQERKNGTIEGIIKTIDGSPAAGVEISIIPGNATVTTDSLGHYKVEKLNAGKYKIKAQLIGTKQKETIVSVSTGAVTNGDLTLDIAEQSLREVIIQSHAVRLGQSPSDIVAKIPLSNLENAQVYSTISKELMAQQLAFNVTDALKNTPGVTQLWEAVGRAGIGGAYYSQRGFVTQPKARNGVSGNAISDIDASSIERVEVIKGPSATLFGNNISSYGGLINIITKKPYQDFGGMVQYAGGGYGLNRFTIDLNTPLDKEHKALFRINGAYNYQRTFQDFGFRKTFYVAPSLSYKVNDRLSFQFDAELQSSQMAGGASIFYFITPSSLKSTVQALISGYPTDVQEQIMSAYPQTASDAYGTDRVDKLNVNYNKSFYTNDLVNKLSVANFYARMDYKISSQWNSQTIVTSNSNSSNGYMPFFYVLPNFVPNMLTTGSFGTAGADYIARMIWKPVGDQSITEAQQNFVGDFTIGSMRNRFVGGLDFYYNNYNMVYTYPYGKLFGLTYPYTFDVVPSSGVSTNYLNFNQNKVDSLFSASTLGTSSYPQKIMTYSAYANDVLNVTDQLLVSAGLRIDRFENKGAYNPNTGITTGKYGQTALSPKFGLIYQIIKDQISMFGNYQNGFTNQTGTDYEGKTFKPEQANQWEAGVKLNTAQGRLSGSLSYYDIKVKNMVRTDPDHPTYSIQDANQVSKGFEAELSAQPVDGLSLVAGYSYNNSKYENSSANIDGLRPTTAGPKNTVNFWGSYGIVRGDLKGLAIGFGGNYAGESFAINSVSDGQMILPSYTILNAVLSYNQPKFTISAKLNNLTNKHYYIGYTTMNPQMLRQFVGSIAFKF